MLSVGDNTLDPIVIISRGAVVVDFVSGLLGRLRKLHQQTERIVLLQTVVNHSKQWTFNFKG